MGPARSPRDRSAPPAPLRTRHTAVAAARGQQGRQSGAPPGNRVRSGPAATGACRLRSGPGPAPPPPRPGAAAPRRAQLPSQPHRGWVCLCPHSRTLSRSKAGWSRGALSPAPRPGERLTAGRRFPGCGSTGSGGGGACHSRLSERAPHAPSPVGWGRQRDGPRGTGATRAPIVPATGEPRREGYVTSARRAEEEGEPLYPPRPPPAAPSRRPPRAPQPLVAAGSAPRRPPLTAHNASRRPGASRLGLHTGRNVTGRRAPAPPALPLAAAA